MKILIITQTLDSNHSVLGFFVRWVLEFAKQCDQVTVFCLDKGEDVFPENVTVVHIPRTWHGVKTWPLTLAYKAFVYRKEYTHVFVHMNPEYILSAGLIWKILGKKISLWYTHSSVTLRLKIAVFFSEKVFSANKESFRYKTNKLNIFGHGIDLGLYKGFHIEGSLKNELSIAYIGRISKTKRIDFVLETLSRLHSDYNIKARCTIIGGPLTEVDIKYQAYLLEYVKEKGLDQFVSWTGPLPLPDAISVLKEQDIFIHTSQTGSLDKAVLDAMMCGVITYSTNEAIYPVLENLNKTLCVKTPIEVAENINVLVKGDPGHILNLRKRSREYVENNFSLVELIQAILKKIYETSR